MSQIYKPPHSLAVGAAFSAYQAPSSNNVTVLFDVDSRTRKLIPQPANTGLGKFGSPTSYNYTSYIKPNGFTVGWVASGKLAANKTSANFTDYTVLRSSRITTKTERLNSLKVREDRPLEQFISIDFGIEPVQLDQPKIDYLNFLVKPVGIFYDGITPRAPLSLDITARFGVYVKAPSSRVTSKTAVIGAPVVDFSIGAKNQSSSTYGFDHSVFGSPVILQSKFISPSPFHTQDFGRPYVEGLIKDVSPKGFNSQDFGRPSLLNTLKQTYAHGFSSQDFGRPSFSKVNKEIYPKGFGLNLFGLPTLVNTSIELKLFGFNAQLFGEAKLFNLKQISKQNGFLSSTFGRPSIEGKLRYLQAKGFDYALLGEPLFENSSRDIFTKGFSLSNFGRPLIENKTKYIIAGIGRTERFGASRVWHLNRRLNTPGFNAQLFGLNRVEHAVRSVVTRGSAFDRFGSQRTWYRVREVSPSSIFKEFPTNHTVGGEQTIFALGFDSSQFGLRIVPEITQAYGFGFNAAAVSEDARVEHFTRWVRLKGFFSSGGDQESARYGRAELFNKRQYIIQEYDSLGGLNPQPFGRWVSIENRNRYVGAIGFDSSKSGYTAIFNNARPISDLGFNSESFGKQMVSHRVRSLKPEPIESAPPGNWGVVYNTADVISPNTKEHTLWGKPSVINTRREYRWVGAFESMAFGQPMISDRIRELSFDRRYTIGPISIPIAKVELYTRYIEPIGFDLSSFGAFELHIKWNIIGPRWNFTPKIGTPEIKNLTPELFIRGAPSDEFGKPLIFLYRQDLPLDGSNMEIFGRTLISHRDRSVSVPNFNQSIFGRHVVTKTGAPPYSLQFITLDWGGEGVRPENFNGDGIGVPMQQVASPSLRDNIIKPIGFNASDFGGSHLQSNGILLESGINQFIVGSHNIGLKNRVIDVPTLGDLLQIKETRPRISPHTIYAVREAPRQAIANHNGSNNLHYVNSDGGSRAAGEVFGRASISLQNRQIKHSGYILNRQFGEHKLELKKRYIQANGFNSQRMGWHIASDGRPQHIEQYDSSDTMSFGRLSINKPDYGPKEVSAKSFNSNIFGVTDVSFFHRNIYAMGWVATQMGTRKANDTQYMPQGLWVGGPNPTKPKGFRAESFGKVTISLKVREVNAQGFNSFVSEFDISKFKDRLKVTLIKKPVLPIIPESQSISPIGFDNIASSVPDIKLKVQYIRPDGNSNQYRKGGKI